MPRTTAEQAPAHMRKWLDQVRSVPPLKDYDSFEQLASIIEFRNPRFGAQRCHFIARAWARPGADGRVRLLGDSRHRWVNPVLYNRDHAEAIWRQIKSPMLMLLSENSQYLRRLGRDATASALESIIPGIEVVRIAGAGHMLHIERPDLIAPVIEKFLSAH
jgi:pimeloyl-ACP methyl ester carboxylesterase